MRIRPIQLERSKQHGLAFDVQIEGRVKSDEDCRITQADI